MQPFELDAIFLGMLLRSRCCRFVGAERASSRSGMSAQKWSQSQRRDVEHSEGQGASDLLRCEVCCFDRGHFSSCGILGHTQNIHEFLNGQGFWQKHVAENSWYTFGCVLVILIECGSDSSFWSHVLLIAFVSSFDLITWRCTSFMNA